MNMQAFTVVLYRRIVDIVFYAKGCDCEYVRNSLINHDGYHPHIKVFD